MKIKHIISLSLCIWMAFGSCSTDQLKPSNSDTRAIRLSAGLDVTRAAITTGSSFTAAVAGWESTSQANYTTTEAWQTTATITASETPSAITLSTQPYYNQNSSMKSYIRAWHPAGILSNGIVTLAGTPDGTTDLLLSDIVVGSAIDNESKSITFNHQLTQLKFKLVCNDEFDLTTTIKSITVKDAELPTGIDLATSTTHYTLKSPVALPAINTTQFITTTATLTGDALMVRPFVGNTFKADIETSVASYKDVIITIDDDTNFKAGKSYTITIRFSTINTDISASAAVTPWSEGTGSGDITTN